MELWSLTSWENVVVMRQDGVGNFPPAFASATATASLLFIVREPCRVVAVRFQEWVWLE